jgi:serine/threonine protein phosphatase 1
MTVVTYAIGDIHGRLDLLTDLLAQIETDAAAHGAGAKVVFCGDYVDRGANSFGVVERLIAGPSRPIDRFVCLRGNHDILFIQAVRIGQGLPDWAEVLYAHTQLSYHVENRLDRARLHRHADFLDTLPLFHDDGEQFFVHAGIRPGVALEAQTETDLTWIRDEFLFHPDRLPRLVVHGHTIMGDRPVVTHNRVSIDTGAYTSGILTAAVFDGGPVRFLQAMGEAIAWAA